MEAEPNARPSVATCSLGSGSLVLSQQNSPLSEPL